MSNYPRSPFRLNVGFIIHQAVGYFRDIPFELPTIEFKPDLQLFNLAGYVRFTRTQQGLLAQVKIQAEIDSECARCLTPCRETLRVDFSEIFAFPGKLLDDENALPLPEDGFIDLEPLLRDYMLLEIPLNPLCREDCQGLCNICGANLNEHDCQHEDEDLDERLSILKSLLDDPEEEQ